MVRFKQRNICCHAHSFSRCLHCLSAIIVKIQFRFQPTLDLATWTKCPFHCCYVGNKSPHFITFTTWVYLPKRMMAGFCDENISAVLAVKFDKSGILRESEKEGECCTKNTNKLFPNFSDGGHDLEPSPAAIGQISQVILLF